MPKIKKPEDTTVYVDAENLQKIKDLREMLAINSQLANIYASFVLITIGGKVLGINSMGTMFTLVAQFFVILPCLYNFHPQGFLWPAVAKTFVEDETLTKANAEQIIHNLEDLYHYRNYYIKFAQTLIIIYLSYSIITKIMPGEIPASSMSLSLTNMIAIIYQGMMGDPFIKTHQQSIEDNNKINNILFNWQSKLNIRCEVKKIYNHKYVVLDFNDVKLSNKNYSRKEIQYIFEILLAYNNVTMNLTDNKKIMFRLKNAVMLTKINDTVNERLQENMDLERELAKLENQLFSIRHDVAMNYQYIKLNNLDRYYKVKLYLPDELSLQTKSELAGITNFVGSNPLTFIASAELPNEVIEKLINISKLLIIENSPVSLRRNDNNDKEITTIDNKLKPKSKGKEREPAPSKQCNAVSSDQVPRISNIIRWPSATYDCNMSDRVVPIEDGYGRFFTYRNFNEDEFGENKQLYLKFKKVVSDHPKFARAKGDEGIKYDKSIKVNKPDGEIKKGAYKAKLLKKHGKFRMSAYEETAETGEVLYVFARKNLFGH